MAPQQNSTLIDENVDDCPSFSNMPEDINRYSPILPLKNKANLNKNNNIITNDNNNKNNYCQHQNTNLIPIWELTGKEQHHYYKNKHYRSGSNLSSYSYRSRSISLYGANSALEQGHNEITIWLGDEIRFISGVTKKTTCNDIIKALIDDEISNGNYEYCQRLKDGTVSRDYSDYVITECWHGIERSYDGNMPILPVWKAWSRVHSEIRLCLKHCKDVQDPTKILKTNTTLSSIRNYICKLLSFGKNKKCNTKSKKSIKSTETTNDVKENQLNSHNVVLIQNLGAKIIDKQSLRTSSRKNFKNKATNFDIKLTNKDDIQAQTTKLNKEKLYRLSETRSTVRRRRSANRRNNKKFSHEGRRDNSSFLRKRKNSYMRNSVRNKLSEKNAEMNELYAREYALTRELTNKCKMYKLHNELYTTCDRNLEMSVGQIQQNIEACAKEIIQTEHELLEVKNVIKNDISIINNLKRLTLDGNVNDKMIKPQLDVKPISTGAAGTEANSEQMLFVDNIYEFCDNNASMLV